MTRQLRLLCLICLVPITAAHAQSCNLPVQGEARIAAMIDARTLRLDDGRELRLAGLAPLSPDHAARAMATLSTFISQSVTLQGDSDAPDRYGRQTLLATRAGATQPIQSELLAQGDALADLTASACTKPFRQAETIARRSRLGVWADRSVIKNAERPDDDLFKIGHFTIVEGRVLSVRQSGSVTYVNFGRRWTRDFAVTMPSRALPAFEAAGLSPKALSGKRLRVRGFLERNYGPRIEAIRPEQIEIVGADDVASSSE